MTSGDLASAIATYRAGLEAELAFLQQLKQLSGAQHEATVANDLSGLARVAEQRERVMARLVSLEHELKPTRLVLSAHRDRARVLPGFDRLLALHHQAAELVSTITSADQETLEALRHAEQARRLAAQVIETGESTLTAYRRVIAPPLGSATLVDRRG